MNMRLHTMMKILMMFALVIGSSLLFTSCSDKDCTLPTQTSIAIDESGLIDVDAELARIAPDFSDDLFMKGDRTGPGGKRDSVRGGGRDSIVKDTTRMRPVPFTAILPCLKLTQEQAAKLREFMTAQRECEMAARSQFRSVLEPLRKAQKEALDAIRADLKAGIITREEASAKAKAINDRIRAASLDAELGLRNAVKECMDRLFANIESMLTREQLALWMEWKTTGKNPCPGTGNPIGIRP